MKDLVGVELAVDDRVLVAVNNYKRPVLRYATVEEILPTRLLLRVEGSGQTVSRWRDESVLKVPKA